RREEDRRGGGEGEERDLRRVHGCLVRSLTHGGGGRIPGGLVLRGIYALADPATFANRSVVRAVWPLTPPSPSLPPHSLPPGERGLEKTKANFFFCSLSPLPGEGSAAGEEGRGGEGPGGADTARFKMSRESEMMAEKATPPMRVHFTNLGCKLNQAEIERLSREFTAAGHVVVGSLAEADLHVVNSCTVTHLAAHDSRKAAGRARRRCFAARTVLTGCHVAADPEEAARVAGVDLVVPNAEKDRLLERVHAAFPEALPVEPPIPCASPQLAHTRALVKVEDGCNMRCAFCVIPATRGAQRSRPLSEVVEEVRQLVRRGF